MSLTVASPRALAIITIGALFACALALDMSTARDGLGSGIGCDDPHSSASSLSITSFIDMTGKTVYVGGQSFQVQVSVRNSGTTNLRSLNIFLTFGGYAGLSAPSQQVPTILTPGMSTMVTLGVMVLTTATTQDPVTITAHAEASEEMLPVLVQAAPVSIIKRIQARANVSISALEVTEPFFGTRDLANGLPFTLRVTFANTGGTTASVDAIIDDGTYTGLLWDDPANVTVLAGSTGHQNFTVTTDGATPQPGIVMTATWRGSEQHSTRSLSGDTQADSISIDLHEVPDLSITDIAVISPRAAPGPFIAGESIAVRVTYTNNDDHPIRVDAMLDAGAYTGLAFDTTEPVWVEPASTAHQEIPATLLAGAATANVTIEVTWYDAEHPGVYGDAPADTVSIDVRSRALVSITGLAITSPRAAPGPYYWGELLVLRVNFGNTGGASASVDATVDDGTYTGLSFGNDPDNVTVEAGGTAFQDFTIVIGAAAPPQSGIPITATWRGSEQHSTRFLSGDAPADTTQIDVLAGCYLITQTILGGRTAFVRGETYTLRVVIDNTYGPPISGGTLDTVEVTGNADNATYTGITVNAGATATYNFLITTSGSTPASYVQRVLFTATTPSGFSQYACNNISIATVSPAVVSISSLAIIAPRAAPGPYAGGETLTLRVTFSNAAPAGSASASVDAVIDDGAYTGLTFGNPSNITVLAGGTASQDHTIVVLAGAMPSVATLTVIWKGSEQYSTWSIGGDTPADTLTLNIGWGSRPSITCLSIVSPRAAPGPYIQGEDLTVRVTFSNTGERRWTVDATLDDGAYTGLSFTKPAPVTVEAGGTVTQDHVITTTGATTSAVIITATWNGTEDGTGFTAIGDTLADTLAIHLQSQAVVSISDMSIVTLRPAPGPYIGGETFKLQVTLTNTGGTAASARPSLDDGSYTGLSWSHPSNVTVPAGGSARWNSTFVLMAGALTQANVVITATWRGSEATSTRGISGDTPHDTLNIDVLGGAVVSIVGLSVIAPRAAPGPYYGSETLTLRVTFSNTAPAGSASASVDATVDDGAYAGLTFGNPANVTVNAGGTATQDHTITVSATPVFQDGVVLTVTWRGSEATSTRFISGDMPTDTIGLDIGWTPPPACPYQYIIGGRTAFVRGETYTLRVVIDNTYGPPISGGTLDTVEVTGNADNATYTGITVNAGATATYNFLITTSGSTPASYVQRVLFTATTPPGFSQYACNNITITATSPSAVSITGLAITSPRAAPGPYTRGESFTLRVTFVNAGGTSASVDVTLDDGTYTGLAFGNPANVTVLAGGSATQDHVVTVSAWAAGSTVTLAATWRGSEQYSTRAIGGDDPVDHVVFDIETGNLPPIACISVNATSGRIGTTVSFTSAAMDPDGTIVAWTWDFGDEMNATGQSCVHAFTYAGNFTVVLRVLDDYGASDEAHVVISIFPEATPAGDEPATAPGTAVVAFLTGAISLVAGAALTSVQVVKRRGRRSSR